MAHSIFFTADNHFSHSRILNYCNRPFKDVETMDECMIANWNTCVKPNDEIFHLGDFCFDPDRAINIIKRLKGKKYLIKGNHDREKTLKVLAPYFVWIKDVHQLKVQDKDAPEGIRLIWLSHYSHRIWPQSHYGSWHLYGHSHGTLPDLYDSSSIDVGVDARDYRPISYSEIKSIMSRKTFKGRD